MGQLNGHSHIDSWRKLAGRPPKFGGWAAKLRIIESIFHHNAQDRIKIRKLLNIFVFQMQSVRYNYFKKKSVVGGKLEVVDLWQV